MSNTIDGSTVQIDGVRFRQASGDPAAPAASHWLLYAKAAGLFIEDSSSVVTGPFGTGGGGGATVELTLTNDSAGTVNLGDIVFISDFAASSFEIDTDIGFAAGQANYRTCVVLDATIASAASGRVAYSGYVGQVNLDSSASAGNFLFASGAASQATPYGLPGDYAGALPGAFGMALDVGTTPPAVIWNPPVKQTEQLIASMTGANRVDVNTATAQLVYTVPTVGASFMVTRVIARNASTSLTTASWSIGYNNPNYDDVIASAVHAELTGNTVYSVVPAKAGAALGAAAAALYFKCSITQGAPAVMDLDVYGVRVP